jgi:hypothetical protein
MNDSTALTIPGQLNATGLNLGADLSIDEWRNAGAMLYIMGSAVQWAIGDWLLHGAEHFEDEYMAVALEIYKPETIRGLKWMAEKFPAERRHKALTFAHHREVAALSPAEQDAHLSFAEADKLTVKQLRKRLRPEKKPAEPKVDDKETQCPFCFADLTEWLEGR